jgi:hypothetical protein
MIQSGATTNLKFLQKRREKCDNHALKNISEAEKSASQP